MKNRTGLTLIELLIILAISFCAVVVLLQLASPGILQENPAFEATVIRKYEVYDDDGTTYRVDVQVSEHSPIEILTNENVPIRGKFNSAQIHANLIEGKRYHFKTRGIVNEILQLFPNIEEIEEIHE